MKAKGASPEKKKIEKVRRRCTASLFWVAWYLCDFAQGGRNKLSLILHYGLWLWLKKGREQGLKKFLCLIPRGHFKTSFLTIAGTVHDLIVNPDCRILIVMHNLDEAKRKGRKLRAILKGNAFRTYFPELYPPEGTVWTTTEFSINRPHEFAEASVTLAGMASGVVGGHYDKIKVDDGVEFKAARSAEIMKAAVEFLDAIKPLLEDEDSEIFIIGTLWPGGDVGYYERLLKDKTYHKLVLGCYCDDRWDRFLQLTGVNPEKLIAESPKYLDTKVLKANRAEAWKPGQAIFPERRTMKGLADDYDSMGDFTFSHQMLNILKSKGSRRFHREYFGRYSISFGTSGQPQAIYIDTVQYPWSRGIVTVAMDPTGGLNKDCDWCGITACWWLPPLKLACLLDHYHEQQPDPMEQLLQFMNMSVKWGAEVMIPEAGSMQVWVGAWLKQEIKARKIDVDVAPFTPGSARKGDRILDRFHPFCKNRQFFVLYPEHEEVVDHLVSLNIDPESGKVLGDSPALADTFPMHIDYWYATDADRENDPDRVWDEDEDSGNVVEFQKPRYRLAASRRLRMMQ